ncbi:MAG: hypothetical protein IJ605_03905 [Prevotella sp.]|nr:hypothetical protein [Prevotella sp.]
MKKSIVLVVLSLVSAVVFAQENLNFKGKIVNDQYQVWIEMDFHEMSVVVPDQEIFGKVAGYLGAKRDPRKWIVMEATLESEKTAQMSIINDYGSEDLVATLTRNGDGSYTLKQVSGSTMKIVVNGKWLKLPKTLVFKPTA